MKLKALIDLDCEKNKRWQKPEIEITYKVEDTRDPSSPQVKTPDSEDAVVNLWSLFWCLLGELWYWFNLCKTV